MRAEQVFPLDFRFRSNAPYTGNPHYARQLKRKCDHLRYRRRTPMGL